MNEYEIIITRVIEEVNEGTLRKVARNMVKRVDKCIEMNGARNMVKRVDKCIEMNGHYFQHLL